MPTKTKGTEPGQASAPEATALDVASELADRFVSHPLTPEQSNIAEYLRTSVSALAEEVAEMTMASREQSLALTHLEEALMWSVKAVAIHGVP